VTFEYDQYIHIQPYFDSILSLELYFVDLQYE
jgi:hypothetical protein